MQILGEPWKTWLLQTKLEVTENNIALLIVNDSVETYSTIEVLNKAYSVAKKIYPQINSIIVVSGDIYNFIDNKIAEIHDIKIVT